MGQRVSRAPMSLPSDGIPGGYNPIAVPKRVLPEQMTPSNYGGPGGYNPIAVPENKKRAANRLVENKKHEEINRRLEELIIQCLNTKFIKNNVEVYVRNQISHTFGNFSDNYETLPTKDIIIWVHDDKSQYSNRKYRLTYDTRTQKNEIWVIDNNYPKPRKEHIDSILECIPKQSGGSRSRRRKNKTRRIRAAKTLKNKFHYR